MSVVVRVARIIAASHRIALIDAGRFAESEPCLARLEAATANPSIPASVRIKSFLERIARYRDFDAAAQRETREYAPVFKFKVATAWRLAQRR